MNQFTKKYTPNYGKINEPSSQINKSGDYFFRKENKWPALPDNKWFIHKFKINGSWGAGSQSIQALIDNYGNIYSINRKGWLQTFDDSEFYYTENNVPFTNSLIDYIKSIESDHNIRSDVGNKYVLTIFPTDKLSIVAKELYDTYKIKKINTNCQTNNKSVKNKTQQVNMNAENKYKLFIKEYNMAKNNKTRRKIKNSMQNSLKRLINLEK
jgi:hypothetical protein